MPESYVIRLGNEALQHAVNDAHATLRVEFNLRPQGEEALLLERFVGLYAALTSELRRAVNGSFPERQKLAFIDLYALNVSACYALGDQSTTGSFPYNVPINVEQREADPRIRRKLLLHEPLNLYRGSAPVDDEKKADHVRGFLSSIVDQTESVAEEPCYAALKSHFGAFAVEIAGRTFRDVFSPDVMRTVAVQPLEAGSLEEIVGNEELKEALISSVNALSEYGLQGGIVLTDLIDLPRTINAYGPPGTGKSSTIVSVYQWAKRELEPTMAVKLELLQISNSQKSKYFSESAKKIDQIFDQVEKGERAYLIVIDDIDKVIHGNGANESSTEERNVMEALMRRIEGLSTSPKFNYVLVTTTNEPLMMNAALGQRLAQLSVAVPGPVSPEECAQIMRLKLAKAYTHDYASNIDLEALGVLLHQYAMNGRDIRNVARTVFQSFREGVAQGRRRFGGADLAAAIAQGYRLTHEMVVAGIEDVRRCEEEKRTLQIGADVAQRVKQIRTELMARSIIDEEHRERIM